MRKLVLKVLSILAAFVLGILGMSYYMTAGNADLTDSMAEATLPLIYMEQDGRLMNLMHGYTQSMDGRYIRDTVLPLPEDRGLKLQIKAGPNQVKKVYYEVRSLDTERLIEDTEADGCSFTEDTVYVQFQLKDLLDPGEEYLLVIRLELEREKEAYYYTHLANLPETHLNDCLRLVDEIHEALFDKENTVNITQYLEPDASADNNTLDHVTIHSRYRQWIWGDMEVEPDSEVRTFLTEIEDSVASVRLEYEVVHVNENQERERYEVQESYRVRYLEHRMYLLAYDRTVNRIFDPQLQVFTPDSIHLGILNDRVEYRKNDEENIVGFVQNGDLWCYDAAQNKLSRVFGFRDGEDLRCSYGEHDIKIVDVDESGSMNFLVYGYMNRGRHEGKTGVAVYTYNAMTNSVEERAFIESRKPFPILRDEVGTLSYVNSKEELYLYLQGNICRIDLNTREYEKLVSGIPEECCMISDDGHILAWHEGNSIYESPAVVLLDLETGKSRRVEAGEEFYIRALGFMGTDFIYGKARKGDIVKDLTGNRIFPMGYVVIENERGKVIQEFPYEEKGKYVVSISIESNRISQECVAKNEARGYEAAAPEPITKKVEETVEKIALETLNSPSKKREYYFSLSENVSASKMKYLMPRQVLFEENRNLNPDGTQEDARYYVYAFDGTFDRAYVSANEAIRKAHDSMGVVVDRDQNYIWKRGGRKNWTEIAGVESTGQPSEKSSLQAALEVLMSYEKIYGDVGNYLAQGDTPYEILEKHMNGRVLDLSGCSMSMAFYYVSQGYPVLVLRGGDQAELMVGYDLQNVILMNPLTGETYRKGTDDASEEFESLGNLFVAYLPEK